MKIKKLRKLIIKFKLIVKKNQDFIKRIIVSEDFINQLYKVPNAIEIEVKQDMSKKNGEATEADVWFLFGIETVMSSIIKKGCVLEMISGEWTVIKGI